MIFLNYDDSFEISFDKVNCYFNSKEGVINNVKIVVDEKIRITFIDDCIFNNYFENYDISSSNVNGSDLKLVYGDYTLVFQNFLINHIAEFKGGIASNLIIKNYDFNENDCVCVWNLTDEKIIVNPEHNYFDVDCLNGLYVKSIETDSLINKYNVNTVFYYESEYKQVKEYWQDHIDNIFLLLRFFKCKFLFPQTRIIMNNLGNFEINLTSFKSLGEGNSIFDEYYNNFIRLINSTYVKFLKNKKRTSIVNYSLD